MANPKSAKNNIVTAMAKDAPVVISEKNTTSVVSAPSMLTVVVVDEKGQPASGARVSITPSDASNTTSSDGEVQFRLGRATKYDVTVSYGSKTITVPYYVTPNGATRLVVNPIYVRSVERQLHPSFFSSGFFLTVGVILGAVVLFFIVLRFFSTAQEIVRTSM